MEREGSRLVLLESADMVGESESLRFAARRAFSRAKLVAIVAGSGHVALVGCSGDSTSATTSVHADSLIQAAAVARLGLGLAHSCAVTASGDAFCWGSDAAGQLGFGMAGARHATPVRVVAPTQFTTIVAGSAHTCALGVDSLAYCWGDNQFGALGDATGAAKFRPSPVAGVASFTRLLSGASHTCGLVAGGALFCWGRNTNGELADGTQIDRLSPVPAAAALRFTTVSAGNGFTCGVTLGASGYCWGANQLNQLGTGFDAGSSPARSTAPMLVSGAHAFVTIAAGSAHACGLTRTGDVYCWGASSLGQTGNGQPLQQDASAAPTSQASPTLVVGSHVFASVTAGENFSCALDEGGQAYCWGDNSADQLGAVGASSSTPVAVSGSLSFARLFAGGSHACGITVDSVAYCWGGNSSGELGTDSPPHRATPAPIVLVPIASARR